MNSSFGTFKKQIGFTLIEISIVMIIVGLMVVGFIQSYKIYDEKRKIELTELRMNDIDQAINNYALINGRLPCPAARNVPGATYDSGKAVDCTTAIPPGVVDVPGQDVLIGLLPTYDLGIAHGSSRDAHNYAFTYAVTKSLANGTASGAGGAIRVREEYFEDVNADPNVQNIQRKTETYPDVQYVVLSTGETGAGAYAYDGAPLYGGTGPYACQDGDTTDGENCDDDHVFVDSRAANDFYDDRVRYKRLLPVLTASNDGGCEQQDTVTIYGTQCPDGWAAVGSSGYIHQLPKTEAFYGEDAAHAEVNRIISAGYFSNGGGIAVGMGIGHLSSGRGYFNIDPDTGDYYLTSFETLNSVNAPTHPSPPSSQGINCEKTTASNKTRCFSKKVSASGAPGLPTPANNYGCPDGYGPIYKKPPLTNGTPGEDHITYDAGGMVCGK